MVISPEYVAKSFLLEFLETEACVLNIYIVIPGAVVFCVILWPVSFSADIVTYILWILELIYQWGMWGRIFFFYFLMIVIFSSFLLWPFSFLYRGFQNFSPVILWGNLLNNSITTLSVNFSFTAILHKLLQSEESNKINM